MALNQEIWNAINATPTVPEEVKKTLHMNIMKLIEQDRATPVQKKLGVTVMTQEASLAAQKVAENRNRAPLAGDSKPKTI